MFVNLSNHPIEYWEKEQKLAAQLYGELVDIKFPDLDPQWDTGEIVKCAKCYLSLCKEKIKDTKSSSAIHLAGETIFCFVLAQMLLKEGYVCLTSTSKRNAVVKKGIKLSVYKFERFRKYILL